MSRIEINGGGHQVVVDCAVSDLAYMVEKAQKLWVETKGADRPPRARLRLHGRTRARAHRQQQQTLGRRDQAGASVGRHAMTQPPIERPVDLDFSVPAPAPQEVAAGLTEQEHLALDLTAQLWNLLCAIAHDGPSRLGDLAELAAHVHVIQHAVMANAAPRAHPARYRLLGGQPP